MKKLHIVLAACIAVPLLALAQAAPKARPDVALRNRLVHTCKDPNPGNVFHEPDGGLHESAQGWFSRAEVHQGASGPALAYCYYGLDKAAPANRPVYSVHYPMQGFAASQCRVSGKTVTCARPAVLKQ